jgi:hypothetical protein
MISDVGVGRALFLGVDCTRFFSPSDRDSRTLVVVVVAAAAAARAYLL